MQPVPEGYMPLGFAGFTDRGIYSPAEIYIKNDIVHKDNTAWLCLISNTTGIAPEEGENWTLFISATNTSSGITTVDTKGLVGPAGQNTSNQEIIDALAERVISGENTELMISDAFSEDKTYSAGDYAIYNDTLYKFTSAKAVGAWDSSKAQATTVAEVLRELNGNMTVKTGTLVNGQNYNDVIKSAEQVYSRQLLKFGNVVELSFSCVAKQLSGGDARYTIFTIPSDYAPANFFDETISVIGGGVFHIHVDTNGSIQIRTNVSIPENSLLVIHLMWLSKDILI